MNSYGLALQQFVNLILNFKRMPPARKDVRIDKSKHLMVHVWIVLHTKTRFLTKTDALNIDAIQGISFFLMEDVKHAHSINKYQLMVRHAFALIIALGDKYLKMVFVRIAHSTRHQLKMD